MTTESHIDGGPLMPTYEEAKANLAAIRAILAQPIGFAVLDGSEFVTVNGRQIFGSRHAAETVISLHAVAVQSRLRVVEVSAV